ncbi:Imm50 family immunity protein [Kitasatospora sp. NPDC101155]|uniref:Imm50 family immunity protein n=1 Tax=Kitasatospora sp. NPDC101155 TaxID=3364097 RepID=UPI00382B353D
MPDRDWSAELTDPAPIRAVAGSPPPPLTDFDLTSVLIDERETSVTLRFFAFTAPTAAAELWQARGHNAVEFVLVCTDVANLEVDGWSGWPTTSATLTGATVVLAGRGKRVSFKAAGIRAEPPTGHLASRAQ